MLYFCSFNGETYEKKDSMGGIALVVCGISSSM